MASRMRCGLLALVGMVSTASAFAQVASPAYDIVTIKPNKAGPSMIRMPPDGFSGTNVSLKIMIQIAYDIDSMDQIVGLPGWTDSASYDVQAKMDPETLDVVNKLPKTEADAQRHLMLRKLLEDKFQLKQHEETREQPTYVLGIAKGGTKLKDAAPDNPNAMKGPDGQAHPGMIMMRNGEVTAQGISISNLVRILTGMLHRQVIDKTGLTGKYDVSLKFTGDTAPADSSVESAPPLITAVQEQLGLKLDSVKGPVRMIVVDSVAQPVVE